MQRKYETMFIIKPTLTEDEIKARIEFVKETLTKQGAEINATSEWGVRDLAYPIEKNERGYYTVFYFSAEPTAINELERIYRINEDILRSIVIKYERQVELKAWDTMVKKANGEKVPEKRLSYGPSKREIAARKERDARREERARAAAAKEAKEDKQEG